jgi:hypothetical protein
MTGVRRGRGGNRRTEANDDWGGSRALLLGDPSHELAVWYPSVGGGATGDPGPAFTDFCLTRRDEIAGLVRTRLVQTNVVKRSVVLRLGLTAVGAMTDAPVTLIEIGCSAGVHLRFDEYRYEMAGRTWGEGLLTRGRADAVAAFRAATGPAAHDRG